MLFCFHEIIYKMIFVFYRARAKMICSQQQNLVKTQMQKEWSTLF